jgi:hypothetical protein
MHSANRVGNQLRQPVETRRNQATTDSMIALNRNMVPDTKLKGILREKRADAFQSALDGHVNFTSRSPLPCGDFSDKNSTSSNTV